MVAKRSWPSVIPRLVTSLILGGLVISVGLSVLQTHRARQQLKTDLTGHVLIMTRNMQDILRGLLDDPQVDDLRTALVACQANKPIDAVRLWGADIEPIALGPWPGNMPENMPENMPGNRHDKTQAVKKWTLPQRGSGSGYEVDLDQLTILQAPFSVGTQTYILELLVNGPIARAQMNHHILMGLAGQWLLLGVVVLLGLLLLRRWVTGPLSDVVQLVSSKAGPAALHRYARYRRGEFRQLARAIAGMLDDIQTTTQQLSIRERSFSQLYQQAPAALLSLDVNGKIKRANCQALKLLGMADEQSIVGSDGHMFIVVEDRPLLYQTIARLAEQDSRRCELRLLVEGRSVDAAVEAVAVRDDEGTLHAVRLSLSDISHTKDQHRQLESQTSLLHLVIDNMSDAIVFIDADGCVAAFNERLVSLLRHRPSTLHGMAYDVESFWEPLGVINRELFIARLTQIESNHDRPAQESFETDCGMFTFHGTPVHDAESKTMGRLWVVAETTPQEQSHRLLNEQNQRLAALKRVGWALSNTTTIDHLLGKAVAQLYALLDVEAIGIAVRCGDGHQRSRQLICRGGHSMLLANKPVVKVVEQHLMPTILKNADFAFWPNLPLSDHWSSSFIRAGLTSLAAGPLIGSSGKLGVIWIAQRSGEAIEQHHVMMLQTLAPLIGARLEIAQLTEQLHRLQLTDPVTNLASRRQLDLALEQISRRRGISWSLLVIDLDHFGPINDQLGHEAADYILCSIGRCLVESNRKSCFIARLAGAAFAVLVPQVQARHAAELAGRLRCLIADQVVDLPDGGTASLTASIGVAGCPEDGVDGQSVLGAAEARMELAKRSGRNRVVANSQFPERAAG